MPTIVLIEDDDAVADALTTHLMRGGYAVERAVRGEDGVALVQRVRPDAIVLDLMLPGLAGFDVCRVLRADTRTAQVPLIIASAKGDEDDIVHGLELGADDYLVKPFRARELIARIHAVIRRRAVPVAPDEVCCGPIAIDQLQMTVRLDGALVTLTRAEFRLVLALAQQPGRVFTRDQLLDRITGGEAAIIDRNVDVHIRSLRKKFDAHAEWIETIRGIGYRMRVAEGA